MCLERGKMEASFTTKVLREKPLVMASYTSTGVKISNSGCGQRPVGTDHEGSRCLPDLLTSSTPQLLNSSTQSSSPQLLSSIYLQVTLSPKSSLHKSLSNPSRNGHLIIWARRSRVTLHFNPKSRQDKSSSSSDM